ncbi:hypothetical protein AC1031_010898 [Aphanomyces cochlioides]|nr:hypothetical protein AC1031_010898 [Aphanomyces cochlioides]
MKITAAIALVAASILGLADAQTPVGAYGQCGGNGYSGSTTCVSGYVCNAYSEWYSQCIPGTGGNPTTAPTTAPTTSVAPVTSSPTTAPTTKAPTTKAPTTAPTAPPVSTPSSGGKLLNFEAKLDGIYLNGAQFFIKGASYFGMETNSYAPHGLWGSTSVQTVATLLKSNNFNSVRLPFAVDAVLNNYAVNPSQIQSEVDFVNSFNGTTIRFLDVLDHVIQVLADNKLVVLLDAHVLSPAAGITELWYTSSADATNFQKAWTIVANRYKNTWNVIAADLKNEPHGPASWGSGNAATDWDQQALTLATTIQAIVPRWLIFVEGVQKSSVDQKAFPAFWGENLMDVPRARLTLPVANRLVYSAHTYSSDVAAQPYFEVSNFPANMPAVWDLHFGFVQGKYGPVIIGEYGGRYKTASDIAWQNRFVQYLIDKKIGSYYWCVNPNSGDTEGLLEYDWVTPRTDKFKLLSVLPSTPIP